MLSDSWKWYCWPVADGSSRHIASDYKPYRINENSNVNVPTKKDRAAKREKRRLDRKRKRDRRRSPLVYKLGGVPVHESEEIEKW